MVINPKKLKDICIPNRVMGFCPEDETTVILGKTIVCAEITFVVTGVPLITIVYTNPDSYIKVITCSTDGIQLHLTD